MGHSAMAEAKAIERATIAMGHVHGLAGAAAGGAAAAAAAARALPAFLAGACGAPEASCFAMRVAPERR